MRPPPPTSGFGRFLNRIADLFTAIGPSDFVIQVRPGHRVSVRGRLPRSKSSGIVGFFARDLDATGPVTVRGTRGSSGLRLKFSGAIGPQDRQRVRNFLVDHLR